MKQFLEVNENFCEVSPKEFFPRDKVFEFKMSLEVSLVEIYFRFFYDDKDIVNVIIDLR